MSYKITSVNMHAVICVHKTQAWICFDVCVSWHFVGGQSIMNKIQGYISSTVRQNYVILLVREVIFLMLMVLPMQIMQWLEKQSLTYCMLKDLYVKSLLKVCLFFRLCLGVFKHNSYLSLKHTDLGYGDSFDYLFYEHFVLDGEKVVKYLDYHILCLLK